MNVVQPGTTLLLHNVRVEMSNGFMRLKADRWSSIAEAPNPASFEISNINLSNTQYELIDLVAQ